MDRELFIYVFLPAAVISAQVFSAVYLTIMKRVWYMKCFSKSVKYLCILDRDHGVLSRAVTYNLKLRLLMLGLIHCGVFILLVAILFIGGSPSDLSKVWLWGLMLGDLANGIYWLVNECRNDIAICKATGQMHEGKQLVVSIAGKRRHIAVGKPKLNDECFVVIFDVPDSKKPYSIIILP